MRAILVALSLGIAGVAITEALAQSPYGGIGQRQGSPSTSQQGQQEKGKERPRPPQPILRCADLAMGDYTFGALPPNATALAEGEIALRWEVRNAGGAAYVASDSAQQWVALEYVTPGGPQQIALNPLPPPPEAAAIASATTNAGRPGTVSLNPGASWRGYLRATLPPESARRPLRLRLNYAPRRGVAQDCDMDNNTAPILRR